MRPESSHPSLLSALASHLHLLDETYASYLQDPSSVGSSWRDLFSEQPLSVAHPISIEEQSSSHSVSSENSLEAQEQAPILLWAARVQALACAYRTFGHLQADLNPLQKQKSELIQELNPATYGLSQRDLEQRLPMIPLPGLEDYQGRTITDVLESLRRVYCGTVGVEFTHLGNTKEQDFVQSRFEQNQPEPLSQGTKLVILDRLIAAESFERFVHTKYLGAKRFSLEGAEGLIPLLDLTFESAGRAGIAEIALGMAHRGRLNVLTQLFGKPAGFIFSEFEDFEPNQALGKGDVKYHLGFSQDYVTRGGHPLHLSLTFNPSHLETVDPVVLGRVRAKQHRMQDHEHRKVLGILLHGDAAFAGQGMVAECFNLSQVRGYRTGGTIHVVVNNQIGFTTSSQDARSTKYSTDIAKMLSVPIFHVNADDPEAIAKVVSIATEYQQRFQKDVVIDLIGYRKYGHNESDEPTFTQPLMYKQIAEHPSVVALYAERLKREGTLSEASLGAMKKKHVDALESQLTLAREAAKRPKPSPLNTAWKGYQGGSAASVESPETGVSQERLTAIANQMTVAPSGFSVHPKIQRLLEQRASMGRGEVPLDWGMGEALAFGSLLQEGTPIRLSGQDSRRGTFSHRQALLVDTKTGEEYYPLKYVSPLSTDMMPSSSSRASFSDGSSLTDPSNPNQGLADFRVYDSILSESAVMGFEYGYSLECPEGLTLWEAQFGDFVNGAQMIIDQYLSAAEAKWGRLSGLVLLLPHGYEGQGPEHSSARLERFLQLCAEENMQVAYPTTPAQFFHLLRRQVRRSLRKPLIVMTPKSLLRHPLASSPLIDLTQGKFQTILDDAQAETSKVARLVLCSGKIYYDLLEERTRRKDEQIALVRIEELYPLDTAQLTDVVERYTKAKQVYFVQEEPANMGARAFIEPLLKPLLGKLPFRSVSRTAAASPATGSHKAHAIEQKRILDEVFSG